MSRRRWFDVAAVALSIATIGALTFVLRPQATPTVAVSPAQATVVRPQPPRARPSVLFIGDSYTAGSGLPEMSYGCQAAVQMGWQCSLSTVVGTGYVSGGPANRFVVDPYTGQSTSFVERIPRLAVTYQPDIVVLDGGRNDLFPPREDVLGAMVETVQEVRQAWPKAKIVFIRPRYLARPDDDLGFDDDFMARFGAETADTGVEVIDPIQWFTMTDTSAMLSNDGTHPNLRGEQQLGLALVNSLLNHGFAAVT
jgi:lysophospholipase L1-like esterase